MRLLLYFIFFIASTLSIYSVPAYPRPRVVYQPNGDTLVVYQRGDEWSKYTYTEDGYTVILNDEGYLVYAEEGADGNLVPSGQIAMSASKRTQDQVTYLSKLGRGVSRSIVQDSKSRMQRTIQNKVLSKSFPTKGKGRLLCILMSFADKPFVKTKADFQNLFNSDNYTTDGALGSINAYFKEASYGQLDLVTDVVGPYIASNSMKYYGENDSYGNDKRPRELVKEAIQFASNEVNFADYDNDGDGEVESVYIIYSGYGEEAGGGTNTDAIWAHAWSLQTTLTYNNKRLSVYSCSSELRNNKGSDITHIGVICHEFGHVLGAPDYYDTDYATGGQYPGTGDWDLQASGSWNDDGRSPAHPNPRTKIYTYKWANATTLTDAQQVIVNPSIDDKDAFYIVETKTTGEYFLIENRQKKGFDYALPGAGLMVYRTSRDIGESDINNSHPQKFYPVVANSSVSIPNYSASSYGSVNSATAPFPSLNKNMLTDDSYPSLKSWIGSRTDKPITEIEAREDGSISFSFISNIIVGADSIRSHQVFLKGSYYGSTDLIERGFLFGLKGANSMDTIKLDADSEFEITIQGLEEKTTYEYKAYGIIDNSYGTVVKYDTIVTKISTLTTIPATLEDSKLVLLMGKVLAVTNPNYASDLNNAEFKWYVNDTLLIGERNSYLYVDKLIPNDVYKVITRLYGTDATLDLVFVVPAEEMPPFLFQNPSKAGTDIQIVTNSNIARVDVYTSRGDIVSTFTGTSRVIAPMDKGVYIIRVEYVNGKSEVNRLVVK